jgi:ABC-type transport system substrate-binding protein
MTWTFHLREGIHYAPPLENVEVTSSDVVRALLRVSGGQVVTDGEAFGPGLVYLPLIEGFSEYADGAMDTIAGVSTPDEHTLRVREVRPDASIVHLFAMAFTAPIPPVPGDPAAAFGAATGHPFNSDFSPPLPRGPRADGYGRFLIATGPYMFEGAADLDPSVPPERQAPISGFTPAWYLGEDHFRGHIALVRNPSWHPATDPNRRAFADRIEIAIAPSDASLYQKLAAGGLDAVMGEDPPIGLLRRYRSSSSLSDRVVTATGGGSAYATINVAQPPFDDPHVRRALALVLDRHALAESTLSRYGWVAGSTATHLAPNPMEGSFLSSWNPFASPNDIGDIASALDEMDASRYGVDGRCSGPVCRDVVVVVDDTGTAVKLRAGLAALGISAVFPDPEGVDCSDPREHVALCTTNWFADYPDAGGAFVPLLSSQIGPGDLKSNYSLVGATPEQLRAWHYAVRQVPTIDGDYERCAAQLGVRAAMCWARLDQLLVGELVAVIPLSVPDVVRLKGAHVVAYSLDQVWGEPSLDRIATKP